jgi:hypothetical protein
MEEPGCSVPATGCCCINASCVIKGSTGDVENGVTLKGVAMPEAMKRKLRAEARKRWPKDKERQDAYVYGTMRKQGWKPSRERKGHGKKK